MFYWKKKRFCFMIFFLYLLVLNSLCYQILPFNRPFLTCGREILFDWLFVSCDWQDSWWKTATWIEGKQKLGCSPIKLASWISKILIFNLDFAEHTPTSSCMRSILLLLSTINISELLNLVGCVFKLLANCIIFLLDCSLVHNSHIWKWSF